MTDSIVAREIPDRRAIFLSFDGSESRRLAGNQARGVALALVGQPDQLVAVAGEAVAALARLRPGGAILVALDPPLAAIDAPVGAVERGAVGAEVAPVLGAAPGAMDAVAAEQRRDLGTLEGLLRRARGQCPHGGEAEDEQARGDADGHGEDSSEAEAELWQTRRPPLVQLRASGFTRPLRLRAVSPAS